MNSDSNLSCHTLLKGNEAAVVIVMIEIVTVYSNDDLREVEKMRGWESVSPLVREKMDCLLVQYYNK